MIESEQHDSAAAAEQAADLNPEEGAAGDVDLGEQEAHEEANAAEAAAAALGDSDDDADEEDLVSELHAALLGETNSGGGAAAANASALHDGAQAAAAAAAAPAPAPDGWGEAGGAADDGGFSNGWGWAVPSGGVAWGEAPAADPPAEPAAGAGAAASGTTGRAHAAAAGGGAGPVPPRQAGAGSPGAGGVASSSSSSPSRADATSSWRASSPTGAAGGAAAPAGAARAAAADTAAAGAAAAAAAAAATAGVTRPARSSGAGAAAPAAPAAAAAPEGDGDEQAAVLAVAVPGRSLLARVRRAVLQAALSKPTRSIALAELGLRLNKHREVGPEYRDAATSGLPRLRDLVEGAAAELAAAGGGMAVEYNPVWKQYAVTADAAVLRRLALRRALAAAYPRPGPAAAAGGGGGGASAEEDAAAVRRAAGAALAYLDAPGAAHPHSMTMPLMGHAVIAGAGAARARLAEARGTSFSLAAVLTGRGAGGGGGGGDYIAMTPVAGAGKAAVLDVGRLLQDAAAGRLGDLTHVQPVPPPAAALHNGGSAGASNRDGASNGNGNVAPDAAVAARPAAAPAPAAAAPATPGVISPRVKAVLRDAVPESRDEALAKRALALVAAASLGGFAALSSAAAAAAAGAAADPPFTLRSSPCGILLSELGLKPPKGQMRALFDTEPHIFQAGKPSPNYLITLVHEPLRRLAATAPDQLAAAVGVLLRGKAFPALRLLQINAPAAAAAPAAAPPAPAAPAPRAATAATTTASAAQPAAPAATAPAAAQAAPSGPRPWPPAPAGQPADYYPRMERALRDRVDLAGGAEFIQKVRCTVALALLRRAPGAPRTGDLPYGLTVKAAAALLKRAFPQAFQDRRPPGVFPVNSIVMAQQMPQLFQVLKRKDSPSPHSWAFRLNVNALEQAAGLQPSRLPDPDDDSWAAGAGGKRGAAAAADDYDEDDGGGDGGAMVYEAAAPPPKAAAAQAAPPKAAAAQAAPPQAAAAAPPPEPTMTAAAVAGVLAAQPARALAAALAPTIPPDTLPEPARQVIAAPRSHSHYSALAHCLSVPQVGLGAKCYNGLPVLVMLYAPAADALNPAAVAAATAGGGAAAAAVAGALAAARGLPATVYIFDAPAAGPQGGLDLMASLRSVLEEPGVAKVVHGCEQVIPWVESAAGCFVSPLLDTRLVAEMLRPLDLAPPQEGVDAVAAQENAPELWPLPNNWQAALTTKYWDFALAVLQHASGADETWLHRPLSDSQLGLACRAVQHLPELWSALTWLLPRLAQFCSVARAQQCRALMAPAPAGAAEAGAAGAPQP